METWTDTHYALTAADDPSVSTQEGAVSLHLPGYCGDGRGFRLRLLPAHLPRLRQLVAALEGLTAASDPDQPWPDLPWLEPIATPVASWCSVWETTRPCACEIDPDPAILTQVEHHLF